MGSNDDYSYWHQLEMSYSKGIKKHTHGTYNCPTDASYTICCRHSAARPHAQKSSPAQFVLLISHSIQNVMQCKELFNYSVVYAPCQYVVTRFWRRDRPAADYAGGGPAEKHPTGTQQALRLFSLRSHAVVAEFYQREDLLIGDGLIQQHGDPGALAHVIGRAKPILGQQ